MMTRSSVSLAATLLLILTAAPPASAIPLPEEARYVGGSGTQIAGGACTPATTQGAPVVGGACALGLPPHARIAVIDDSSGAIDFAYWATAPSGAPCGGVRWAHGSVELSAPGCPFVNVAPAVGATTGLIRVTSAP